MMAGSQYPPESETSPRSYLKAFNLVVNNQQQANGRASKRRNSRENSQDDARTDAKSDATTQKNLVLTKSIYEEEPSE